MHLGAPVTSDDPLVKGQLLGTQSLEWVGFVWSGLPVGTKMKGVSQWSGMWTFQTRQSLPSSAGQAPFCLRKTRTLACPMCLSLCYTWFLVPFGSFFASGEGLLSTAGRMYQALCCEQTQRESSPGGRWRLPYEGTWGRPLWKAFLIHSGNSPFFLSSQACMSSLTKSAPITFRTFLDLLFSELIGSTLHLVQIQS